MYIELQTHRTCLVFWEFIFGKWRGFIILYLVFRKIKFKILYFLLIFDIFDPVFLGEFNPFYKYIVKPKSKVRKSKSQSKDLG